MLLSVAQEESDHMKELIKTIGLKKETILNGIDFTMYEKEFIAIMGPSGSGKSTFLYQLSGMDQPDGGRILFAGNDITEYSEDQKAELRLHQMGFVFQQMNMLSSLDIMDNIILPIQQSLKMRKVKTSETELMEQAKQLMEKTGIKGLEHRKISEVSGGQLQRACICRAIMNHPKIVFADEPTGALNQSASQEIMEEFLRLNGEGMSILIVTHDSKVASVCDRVLYIVDGKITGECILGKYDKKDKEERDVELRKWLEEMKW